MGLEDLLAPKRKQPYKTNQEPYNGDIEYPSNYSAPVILRTMAWKFFYLPAEASRFDKLLETLDIAEIIHINSFLGPAGTWQIFILYRKEVKRIPRKEYDDQIPFESQPIKEQNNVKDSISGERLSGIGTSTDSGGEESQRNNEDGSNQISSSSNGVPGENIEGGEELFGTNPIS